MRLRRTDLPPSAGQGAERAQLSVSGRLGTAVDWRDLVAVLNGAKPHALEPVMLPSRLVVRGSTTHRGRNRTSPAWGTTSVSGSAVKSAMSTVSGWR